MALRQTHTYAALEVSQAAYDEIAGLLRAADYGHAFHEDTDRGTVIDMHGIALATADDDRRVRSRSREGLLDPGIHEIARNVAHSSRISAPLVCHFVHAYLAGHMELAEMRVKLIEALVKQNQELFDSALKGLSLTPVLAGGIEQSS
ncbi:MAG TPA: hypothetical protein VMR25_12500 [Planctomycetaceae bacterium]|nr:hypothetical protein [Planctomycetaceae bacterium]